MGMTKVDYHDSLLKRRTYGGFTDWDEYTTAGRWTTTNTSTGTGVAAVLATTGPNGILSMAVTDATSNFELCVMMTNSPFLFANNRALMCETYMQFTDVTSNNAIIGFGFMSGTALLSFVDTTGEPKTSFSGAVIYKVPGGTQWKTASSVGAGSAGAGTRNVSQSTTPCGGSSYHRLKIIAEAVSSTIMEVTYYVDDHQLQIAGGRPGQSYIKDQLTYTSAAAMGIIHTVKQLSTVPATALWDYTGWEQLRTQFQL